MRAPPSLITCCMAFRQRGGISVIAAVSLTALFASALLAVDLGSLYYTKRHLQSVADNAALSAVNDLDHATAIAENTAALNDFLLPGKHDNSLATTVGRYDETTPDGSFGGTFTPDGDPDLQNAVQVTATTQQPLFFLFGKRQVQATAIATRSDIAGFSVGSGLLDLDAQRSALLNALLGGLLGSTLHLDTAAYRGLATAYVRLLDLVEAHANVGTVDELLNTDITIAELLEITAKAVDKHGVADLGVGVRDPSGVLQELLGLSVSDLTLKLGDLIDIALPDREAAAKANLNVLQLITLAAQVANGNHFLDLPVAVNLPGLVEIGLGLTLIEPPSIAIGRAGRGADGNWRTRAHTAQGRIKLDLKLLGALDPLLGIRVPLYIELARGDAWLESIECRAPREDSTVTIGATSGIASVYIGDVNADAMTNTETAATVQPATLLNVLGLISASAKVGLNLPGGGDTLEFNGPFDAQNSQRIFGVAATGLADSLVNKMENPDPQTVLKVTLLGINLDLSAILDLLLPVLTPVLQLLDSLLAPVLSLLGIQLGYADVTAFHLNCGAIRLVR